VHGSVRIADLRTFSGPWICFELGNSKTPVRGSAS
jgi:hypothetical protein